MSGTTLLNGGVFAGRYRIVGQIGSGGFGVVYKAVHTVTERSVAVKTLWPYFAKDVDFRTRFLRESRLATQVKSEFVVDVLDAGVDEATDMPFLVMELLRGESLNQRVKRKKRFSPEETVVYLSQIAVALDRIHVYGIVHRDLKPANLFLTERQDGSPLVKILDFGIAKAVGTSAAELASATLGTPLYMAPEQFSHSGATSAVDIYALAMIAFRFLAGVHYFRLEQGQFDNVYLFAAELSKGPPEPATVRAARYDVVLPKAFDGWFARAANVDPNARFQAASDAILSLCEELGIAPRPPLKREVKVPTGALSFAVESLEDRLNRKPREQPMTGTAIIEPATTAALGAVEPAVVSRVTAPLPSQKEEPELAKAPALTIASAVDAPAPLTEPSKPTALSAAAPDSADDLTQPKSRTEPIELLVKASVSSPSPKASTSSLPLILAIGAILGLVAISITATALILHRRNVERAASSTSAEPAPADVAASIPSALPPPASESESPAPPPAVESAPTLVERAAPASAKTPATRPSTARASPPASETPPPSAPAPKTTASSGQLWGRE